MTMSQDETNVDQDHVTLTIDGKEVVAKKDELLITAAQKAGVFIPRFCYHDRLKPVGMCRMCLVEIEGVRGMPPACTTPVAQDMVVSFQKDNVEKVQEGVLEFLLINHPLDCAVCDRGGECPLQDQTMSHGPGETRFKEEKRHWEKPIEISDHVLLDRERCIQCSRCTRFADDVAGDPLITFVERGDKTEVNTFPNDPFASYFSGNIVQICPVGALTAKPYRFSSRPWDLESVETTCQGCSIGCKGQAQTSRNEMVRFLGIDSEPTNQGWLCDKGRYGFDFIESDKRIRQPYIKQDNENVSTNLNDVISISAQAIAKAKDEFGADSIAFIGGAKGTNEDAYSMSRLAKGIIGTSKVDSRVASTLTPDLVLSTQRAQIADIYNAKTVVVLGTDLKETLPVLYLRLRKAVKENNVKLINANAYKTSLNELADLNIALEPGNEFQSYHKIKEYLDSQQNNDGKVIVIAGDYNVAQKIFSYQELVAKLLEDKNSYLLPSVLDSNRLGAYEMGLVPGLLPGRVAESSVDLIQDWPTIVQNVDNHNDAHTRAILRQAKKGEIKVLVLSGANLVAKFGDQRLVKEALENVETIIALDSFENETTVYADIFIPITLANEKEGTVTNIEGRVQRVVQVVAPQGVVIDEWKAHALIGQELGHDFGCDDVFDVTNEIARVASSFVHLTTGVLLRARDGAVVPIDNNRGSLIQNIENNLETPSWEPIASQAQVGEDPLQELDREIHHPSANIEIFPQIESPFDWEEPRQRHLDQYSLRLIFVDTFHKATQKTINSKAIEFVATSHISNVVYINPKDLESVNVKEDNLITFQNDCGTVKLRAIPDKNVMRGVVVAKMHPEHPLIELVDSMHEVTDMRIEAGI